MPGIVSRALLSMYVVLISFQSSPCLSPDCFYVQLCVLCSLAGRISLELSRLHGEVHFAVIAQVRAGLGKLSVVRGSRLGMSSHFGVISAETVVQASAAVM